jgi:two-component system chemotaxis response regulator CheY
MARILAVDDSASMRQIVGATLRSAGHSVVEAADGQEALDLAREGQQLDLVITDLNMPRMDGITLVRELRRLPWFRGVPMLVLTTESSPERKLEGRAAGATGWVVKPFNPEKLLSAIARVVTKS